MPTAVITGATRGIGKAIAEKLLSQGFSIAICSRTEKELKTLKTKWQNQYNNAKIVTSITDLSVKDDVKEFASKAIKELGDIDILVNNAGIYTPYKIMEEPDGHLEATMQINMFSAYYLSMVIVPEMQSKKSGHVFNICSVASLKAYNGVGSYGISKYALLGFSDNLREELREDKVKVTALCPGGTLTSSWDEVEVDKERLIAPEDVAEVLWSAYNTTVGTNVETVVIRPTLGDL